MWTILQWSLLRIQYFQSITATKLQTDIIEDSSIALEVLFFLPFFHWVSQLYHPSCLTSPKSSFRSKSGIHWLTLWERNYKITKIEEEFIFVKK